MKLNVFKGYVSNPKALLQEVSVGIVYFIHNGRNAWHSTWSQKYHSDGSFFTTFDEAKERAEQLRTNGSVFYIHQMPCLVLRTKDNTFLVSGIAKTSDPLDPLKDYDPELLYANKEISSVLDYLKGVYSFTENLIIFCSNDPKFRVKSHNGGFLRSNKSYCYSSDYPFEWEDYATEYYSSSIMNLYRIFNNLPNN
ncbi:hypothetical protein B0187_04960 [Haemophilus paracuniculus]|uniref:Uncharacterized protein n=1 Tax=Haemophilus paracuniculus TaxID=734 RepID=A0A1T0ASY6_9PAST|nr:hypothetical protein [Haemophilus paracuniculus]OOR99443.1 hypothetical protein B0187_04960 [Haemophilus paracuniculus]